jgi:hypothetical protein
VADRYQVLFGDPPQAAAASFYDTLQSLEIEENADLPGAIQFVVPVVAQGSAGSEDLSNVGDSRFAPYARVAVVATADGAHGACIFDGYVLSHKVQLDRGTTHATLQVWGQDVTCAMNAKETVKEWNKTDGEVANEIFGNYSFSTASANTQDDSPRHEASKHTLMQRGTDAQFLRDLARRNGKLFRVACTEQAGRNTGYFIKPKLDDEPSATLTLNPPGSATVDALTFEWDVARPSKALAQVLIDTKDPEKKSITDSGLAALDQRSLGDFISDSKYRMEARVTAAVDSAGELQTRAESLLREAGWFVKCEGEADLSRVRTVLRVGTVVRVNGAGRMHSGKYYVWSVRHTISATAHRMKFVLLRNAVGRAS